MAEKKCALFDDGTEAAMSPLRNSEACEPVTEMTPLDGTGAIVGVVRTKARKAGGIIIYLVNLFSLGLDNSNSTQSVLLCKQL